MNRRRTANSKAICSNRGKEQSLNFEQSSIKIVSADSGFDARLSFSARPFFGDAVFHCSSAADACNIFPQKVGFIVCAGFTFLRADRAPSFVENQKIILLLRLLFAICSSSSSSILQTELPSHVAGGRNKGNSVETAK
jgi:hypothetical protein